MAKNAMPVSKAKTAYGLLSEIRKLILEEPKRYDQENTLNTGRDAKEIYGALAPSCGTVGCVAGWVAALKAPRRVNHEDPLDVADEILGLGDNDINCWELFDGDKAGVRWITEKSIAKHAERGAEHIAKFQKKYAAQLKARRV
jgi:hypothetical protein